MESEENSFNMLAKFSKAFVDMDNCGIYWTIWSVCLLTRTVLTSPKSNVVATYFIVRDISSFQDMMSCVCLDEFDEDYKETDWWNRKFFKWGEARYTAWKEDVLGQSLSELEK